MIVKAVTGYCNNARLDSLHEHSIDGYIQDNQFQQCAPAFGLYRSKEKRTYGEKKPRKPKELRLYTGTDSDMFTFLKGMSPDDAQLPAKGNEDI